MITYLLIFNQKLLIDKLLQLLANYDTMYYIGLDQQLLILTESS